MPDNNAFSYSREQGNDIIVSDSLLNDTDTPVYSPSDLNEQYDTLRKLMGQDIKLHWHIVSLSDYWREAIIPRGLRLSKFPAFGKENAVFKEKWESILNKCSMDLMLLLIEEGKKQREELKIQLETLKAFLSASNTEQRLPFEEKLKADLHKLENTVKQTKLRKLRRDEDDCSRGDVYRWQRRMTRAHTHAQPLHRRSRSVSFNLTSSDEEPNYVHTVSNTSATSSSFLEEEWPPISRLPPRNGKPAEEERPRRGRPQWRGARRQGLRSQTSKTHHVQ